MWERRKGRVGEEEADVRGRLEEVVEELLALGRRVGVDVANRSGGGGKGEVGRRVVGGRK